MYSTLDFSRSAVKSVVEEIHGYINACEDGHLQVEKHIIQRFCRDRFYFDINLEYELWLVDNVGIDISINMAQFKNRLPKYDEQYFCRELAKVTHAYLVEMIVDVAFGMKTFVAGAYNYDAWRRRLNAWHGRLYNEPDGVEYN